MAGSETDAGSRPDVSSTETELGARIPNSDRSEVVEQREIPSITINAAKILVGIRVKVLIMV